MKKLLPLDYQILNLSKLSVLNFLILPLVGLINSYLVSNYCGSIQLASQGVANQIFTITYGFISFLPLVLLPLISEFNKNNKKTKIIELMNNSIIFYFILGSIISIILYFYSFYLLGFLISKQSIFITYSIKYLQIKSFTLPIILVNSVIYSVLKGLGDFKSATKYNIKSQIVKIVLETVLINFMGINGEAISSVISELYCFYGYIKILKKKKMIIYNNNNFLKNLYLLLKNGIFIQIRSIISNFNYYYINKQISFIDNDGIITPAHILSCKILDLFSISFSTLASISSIIMAKYNQDKKKSKMVIKRFIQWSFLIILLQSILSYFSLNYIELFSDEPLILSQIYNIFPMIIIYSSINGISLILDGLLHGQKEFRIQTYMSSISFLTVYFLIDNCTKLIQIWYLITSIFIIRVSLNFYFMNS